LTDKIGERYFAATVKSQWDDLEGGAGLRIGIVPQSAAHSAGVSHDPRTGLWVVGLPDPHGFMGLFNDAYAAVAEAIYTIGKHTNAKYWLGPSATAEKVQRQLERAADAAVVEIEDALNDAAQQQLVSVEERLVGVEAPAWLHLGKAEPRVLAPKPSFERLD